MQIDINKKYRTRNGHGVKLYTVTADPPYTVKGVMFLDHYECSMEWQADGKYGPIPECKEEREIIEQLPRFRDYDLIEIPSTDG